MNNYRYKTVLNKDQSINIWNILNLTATPFEVGNSIFYGEVNMTEGYKEIEYPVRKEFLERVGMINLESISKRGKLYYGFDNPRVDFSTFLTTPHHIKALMNNEIYSDTKKICKFSFITCGRICVWNNDELILDFGPYTRNHGSKIEIEIMIEKGKNDFIIYMDDLAERDVNFFFEMKLISDDSLLISTPINFNENNLSEGLDFLESLYFERDIFENGSIILKSNNNEKRNLYITYDNKIFSDGVGGNITDFERNNGSIVIEDGNISLGEVNEFLSSGLTQVNIGIKLAKDEFLFKKLKFAVVNKNISSIDLGDDLATRKNNALKYFSRLDLKDINSAIAELHLGKSYVEIKDKMAPAFHMIETKGDCADFMFAPLISYVFKNQSTIDIELLDKVKELALNFRYWIDEPGNDVMWYFSENHALLFHICQYFAGLLYSSERFEVSKRIGDEQYKLGKLRLMRWFETFKKYGFSEWNSATYIPIDLIGFFSLYYAAPDDEIRGLAKEALDFTFEILAISHHGTTISNTFGRTYEHDLKGMKIGEISNIYKIAWNEGNFNYALRASTMFCLSDYEPKEELVEYLNLKNNQYLEANYVQGINRVQTYLFKSKEYSISSAINYNIKEFGHQQHFMNVSVGSEGTQLWINNPGEWTHSGEGRPSYWAGNGICPAINQKFNLLRMNYDLENAAIKMIHLYLPFWNFDEIDDKNSNWLFIRKENVFIGIYFSHQYSIVKEGDTRNREVQSWGEKHDVLVKCYTYNEGMSFETFKKYYGSQNEAAHNLIDAQLGKISELEWNIDSESLSFCPKVKHYNLKKGEKINEFVEEK